MSEHIIVLNPGGGSEETINAGRIESLEPVKTHSRLSDFRATTPYDLALEDHLGDEIRIFDSTTRSNSTLVFRGYLLDIENQQRDRRCTLSGYGIGYDLTRTQTSKTFTNELVHDAITETWGETAYSATVTAPSPTDTISGETALSVSTTAEFESVLDIADTEPIEISGNSVTLLQSCWFAEGEDNTVFDYNGGRNTTSSESTGDLSGEDGRVLENVGDDATLTFTIDYDIPEGTDNFLFWLRAKSNASDHDPRVDIDFDGTFVTDHSAWDTSAGWIQLFPDDFAPVQSGEHTITIELQEGGDAGDLWILDCVAPLDGRFNYTVNESLDGNNALAGPELYPDQHQITFDTVSVPWSVNEGEIGSFWDDTSNNQRIQLRLDGGTWGPTDGSEDNTETLTWDFGTENGSGIQTRARLSRYGTQTSTPTQGINGQSIIGWNVLYDGDDIPVLNNATIEGSYFDILQELHDRGRMRFWIDHQTGSKPATSAPTGAVTESLDATVLNRTRTASLKDYANHVTVRGQEGDDGTRPSFTASDSSEISTWGQEHLDVTDSTLTTQTECEARARQLLADRVANRDTTGSIEIVPENLTAGPSYEVTWSDNTTSTVAAEEIEYGIRQGDLSGRIHFRIDPIDIGRVVPGLRSGIANTKRGL